MRATSEGGLATGPLTTDQQARLACCPDTRAAANSVLSTFDSTALPESRLPEGVNWAHCRRARLTSRRYTPGPLIGRCCSASHRHDPNARQAARASRTRNHLHLPANKACTTQSPDGLSCSHLPEDQRQDRRRRWRVECPAERVRRDGPHSRSCCKVSSPRRSASRTLKQAVRPLRLRLTSRGASARRCGCARARRRWAKPDRGAAAGCGAAERAGQLERSCH